MLYGSHLLPSLFIVARPEDKIEASTGEEKNQ